MRDRLSRSPVSELLTLTENLEIYECENFLLEGAVVDEVSAYWAAHVAHFYFQVSGEDLYSAGDHFPDLRNRVVDGLSDAGFTVQARELAALADEVAFNRHVIRQYTKEDPLYSAVNRLLRRGHREESIAKHPLVPWISHLNVAIRTQAEVLKTCFRGADMDASTISEYRVNRMFVWSSFTSLSTDRGQCLDGNVLFVVTPRSAISEHGKRAPRAISHLSAFPEEAEVLLPLGCAFKVTTTRREGGRTVIHLDLFDHN